MSILRPPEGLVVVSGYIAGRLFDKHGRLKRTFKGRNGVATVGLNELLNVGFRASASSSWYIGLVDNASFSAFAAADTMSSHSGWVESVVYSDATRRQWSPAAASGGLLTNTASVATFNINGSATLKGLFVTSSNTKSGTAGVLWATGSFDSNQAVVNTDVLELTYRVQLQAIS